MLAWNGNEMGEGENWWGKQKTREKTKKMKSWPKNQIKERGGSKNHVKLKTSRF